MTKENNAAVLMLLADANLKIFFIDFVLLLTKDFFSRSFNSCKFFHERVCCVKKCNLKPIGSN